MGEYAEMMLDGTCCQSCGEFLNDGHEGDGYPQFCASCQPEYDGPTTKSGRRIHRPSKVNCPQCKKLVKKVGLDQHIRDVHEKAKGEA